LQFDGETTPVESIKFCQLVKKFLRSLDNSVSGDDLKMFWIQKKKKVRTKEEIKILEDIKKGSFYFQNAPKKLQNDKEFLLEAVKINGDVLQYAPLKLRNDKEIVLEAVKQNGNSIRCTYDKNFYNDKQIVLAAVKQNGDSLQYTSNDLKNKEKIVL
jgi:hypothetical protein